MRRSISWIACSGIQSMERINSSCAKLAGV
nr:MAG TPA: hypothetical protein [Caudoviricetes sp.]